MKIEQVLGVSERQIETEPYSYTAIIGPTKPWWVDYLPEPYVLPMYDPSQSDNMDTALDLKMDTALHHHAPTAVPPENSFAREGYNEEDGEASVLLVFRDGLDQPIKGMEIKVGSASPSTPQKTDDQGTIQVTPQAKTGKLPVTVKGHGGQEQKVCDIDIARCRRDVKIQSPKVVVSTRSRPHHAPSPEGSGVSTTTPASAENRPWYEANGALEKGKRWLAGLLHPKTTPVDRAGSGDQPHVIAESVTRAGHPATVIVGPEVDKVNNLRLGEDNIYREIILRAAQRAKIVPHAICGLLACEAVRRIEKVYRKDKHGEIVRHLKGNHKGQPVLAHAIPHEWDARSYNSGTHAAGLTQFLPLTWLACLLKPGYFISDESLNQKKPWIGMENGRRVFVLSDGKKIKRDRIARSYKDNATDPNIIACLEYRFNPEWSIMAAVDYALGNWKDLFGKEGIVDLDSLTDGEKAKVMYLLHHEGPGDGPKFIRNTLVVDQGKFGQNISDSEKWLKKANNDRSQAYRLSLADYIDRRIEFARFSYNVNAAEKIIPLFDIFQKIAK